MTDWTTRMLPELTRPFGVEESHTVVLLPPNWPGFGTTVYLGIPECELQICFIDAESEPVAFINQPKVNRNLRQWTRAACEVAADYKACLLFCCDTADQVERAARKAMRWLPTYERMALERMYHPGARVRRNLS